MYGPAAKLSIFTAPDTIGAVNRGEHRKGEGEKKGRGGGQVWTARRKHAAGDGGGDDWQTIRDKDGHR